MNLLDFLALTTDDGAHEVVGDQETEGAEGVAGEVSGVGERGVEEESCDFTVGLDKVSAESLMNDRESTAHLGDLFDAARDTKHSILNSTNDLANARLYFRLIPQLCNRLPCLSNDDPGFLGRDQRSKGDCSVSILSACVQVDGMGRGGDLRDGSVGGSVGSGGRGGFG